MDNRPRIVDSRREHVDEGNGLGDASERYQPERNGSRFDTGRRLSGPRSHTRSGPADEPTAGLTEEQLFRGYGMPLPPSSPVAPTLAGPARRSAAAVNEDRFEGALVKVELEAGLLASYLESLELIARPLVMTELQFARLTNALLEVGTIAGRILERDLAADMGRRSSRT